MSKTNLTFGQALEAIKDGRRVCREGWNGKGMWLSLSGAATREIPANAFWSINNAEYAAAQPNGCAKVLPCITMKTATGEILMGWLASQTDLLAEDWCDLDANTGVPTTRAVTGDRFRKKPVVIEAIQLPPAAEDPTNEFLGQLHKFMGEAEWASGRDGTLEIATLEGVMTANPGDWIIRGVKGELYPCKPDIFAATYEPAEPSADTLKL